MITQQQASNNNLTEAKKQIDKAYEEYLITIEELKAKQLNIAQNFISNLEKRKINIVRGEIKKEQ